MQIEVAQIRQQWSEQERRGQPAYRSRIQRLHAQQVAQEDKMLRGHIGSWRANAKTSAIDEPSGCGDCEHGQVNRKTCPALVAKGRSDAAREHLTSPGTDTRTRTGSNSIGKAKEQWGGEGTRTGAGQPQDLLCVCGNRPQQRSSDYLSLAW